MEDHNLFEDFESKRFKEISLEGVTKMYEKSLRGVQ
jgi:hypothetical protein